MIQKFTLERVPLGPNFTLIGPDEKFFAALFREPVKVVAMIVGRKGDKGDPGEKGDPGNEIAWNSTNW